LRIPARKKAQFSTDLGIHFVCERHDKFPQKEDIRSEIVSNSPYEEKWMAQSVKRERVRSEGCQIFSEVGILGGEGFQATRNQTKDTGVDRSQCLCRKEEHK